jgi:hypothetical protein
VSTRELALNNATVALNSDAYAIFDNPASLSSVKNAGFYLNNITSEYQWWKYYSQYLLTLPFKGITVGTSYSTIRQGGTPPGLEDDEYELTFGLPVGQRLRIGAGVAYDNASNTLNDVNTNREITQTGNGTFVRFGLLYSLSRNWQLGAAYRPEAQVSLGAGATAGIFPRTINAGIGYDRQQLTWGLSLDRLDGDLFTAQNGVATGLEYRLFNGRFPVRIGLGYRYWPGTDIAALFEKSAGFSLRIRGLNIDVAGRRVDYAQFFGEQYNYTSSISFGFGF